MHVTAGMDLVRDYRKELSMIIIKAKDLLHASSSRFQFDDVEWAMPWIGCWIEAKPAKINQMLQDS